PWFARGRVIGSLLVPSPELTIDQRRALQLLADESRGITDTALRAHGFSPTLIVGLVGAGYAEAKPRTMKAGGRTFAFMQFVITGAGRRGFGVANPPYRVSKKKTVGGCGGFLPRALLSEWCVLRRGFERPMATSLRRPPRWCGKAPASTPAEPMTR